MTASHREHGRRRAPGAPDQLPTGPGPRASGARIVAEILDATATRRERDDRLTARNLIPRWVDTRGRS